MLSVYEITKKKNKTKRYYKDKIGKNQKQMQTGHSVKSRNRQHDEQCAGGMNSAHRKSIPAVVHCSSLFDLLSFYDLICNDEFNSGSSCLN